MWTSTTCPICGQSVRVPEGAMGKRCACPNCQSPFIAGKSQPLTEPPLQPQPAVPAPEPPRTAERAPAAASCPVPQLVSPPVPPSNKTVLGELEPPIHYTCPRCKAALESLASEAGTKKPCPACGQRLQVPTPRAAPPPIPQKTMLAVEDNRAEPNPLAARANQMAEEGARRPVASDEAARRTYCLECGQDVTGREQLPCCQDCGRLCCSAKCVREHRAHAHATAPTQAHATVLIRFTCQWCGEHLTGSAEELGMTIACPHCGRAVKVRPTGWFGYYRRF